MTRSTSAVLNKLARLMVVATLVVSAGCTAFSQSSSGAQSRTPSPPGGDDKDDSRMFASMEDEMRAKREVAAADKAYKENLNRARDLASIGESLCGAFKEKRTLNDDDIKKLEKAEKLVKRIRESAGGSDDEIKIENAPKDLATAITRLSDLTESLRDKVEKTPKHVISAAVIDEANVLLELIRIVRGMQPKT